MCIYFFLQKIEMLFKYMNKSIPNNQQTNDGSALYFSTLDRTTVDLFCN